MRPYELYTNEGKRYVMSTDTALRDAMYRYIRNKIAKGIPLSAIVFTYSRITFSSIPTGE